MKRFIVLFAIGGIVLLPIDVFAVVAGTDHDLRSAPDQNVCSFCHIPHNAAGDNIWSTYGNEAQLTTGPSTPIGNMCYTCHDGTVTSEGQATVFNTALQQHIIPTNEDCNFCHTVHDDTNENFLIVSRTTNGANVATYCETCHDSTPFASNTLGDHVADTQHPYEGGTVSESCLSCHQAHGAADYTAGSITYPILVAENTNSALCVTCHDTYAQAAPGGNQHPANTPSGGTNDQLSCQTCHDVHQPTVTDRTALLQQSNTDSAYCTSCHTAAGAPGIGANSHPVGLAPVRAVIVDGTPTAGTPLGNVIDDDGDGADYPNNSAQVICESCHSPHSRGVASPLLRISETAGSLCLNCHGDK